MNSTSADKNGRGDRLDYNIIDLTRRIDALDDTTFDICTHMHDYGVPSKYVVRYQFLYLTGEPLEDRMIHRLRAAILSFIIKELHISTAQLNREQVREWALSNPTQEFEMISVAKPKPPAAADVREEWSDSTGGYKITINGQTEETVQDAIDRVLQSYHPMGYGTRFGDIVEHEKGFAALGWRSKSAD